jgi:glutamyl-tRNA reductase
LEKENKRIYVLEESFKKACENHLKQEMENRQIIDQLVKELDKKSRQLDVFLTVQNLEKRIIATRTEEQRKYLKQQEDKERELQQEYYRLTHK